MNYTKTHELHTMRNAYHNVFHGRLSWPFPQVFHGRLSWLFHSAQSMKRENFTFSCTLKCIHRFFSWRFVEKNLVVGTPAKILLVVLRLSFLDRHLCYASQLASQVIRYPIVRDNCQLVPSSDFCSSTNAVSKLQCSRSKIISECACMLSCIIATAAQSLYQSLQFRIRSQL